MEHLSQPGGVGGLNDALMAGVSGVELHVSLVGVFAGMAILQVSRRRGNRCHIQAYGHF
jgi:hypothetical protein